jgi:hypothetical protein
MSIDIKEILSGNNRHTLNSSSEKLAASTALPHRVKHNGVSLSVIAAPLLADRAYSLLQNSWHFATPSFELDALDSSIL